MILFTLLMLGTILRAQLFAWAGGDIDVSAWNSSFLQNHTIIAEINGMIVGFGDITSQGYLDRLYVHKDFQRQGVATAIVNALEQQAFLMGAFEIFTHSSITAQPFFQNRGYMAIRKNQVERKGIILVNFTMKKSK